MPSKESEFLANLYKSWTARMTENPEMPLEGVRGVFEEWERPTLEPEDVCYKSDTVGGVGVIWAYPVGGDKSKVMMFYHGGGFAFGSSSSHRKLAGHVAKALGVSVVVLDYKRSPEHPYPSQINEAVDVYKALLDSGIEARNIGTIGDSAGGNLAVAAVLKFRDLGLDLPCCVIAFSPWLDMEISGETLDTNAETDELASRDILTHVRDMYIGGPGPDEKNPLVNPLYADFTGFPPLYMNAGSVETLLDDARRLHARASAAGVNARISVVDGMQHVFPFLAGRAPEADEEIARIAEWYRSL